ncbi:MAG: DUF4153 domain-containing protein [Peptoniphilus sp.]
MVIISAALTSFFFIMSTYNMGKSTEDFYLKFAFLSLFAIFLFAFVNLFNEGLLNYFNLNNLERNHFFAIISYALCPPILYGIYELINDDLGVLYTVDAKFIFITFLFTLVVGTSFIAKAYYHKDYVAYFMKIMTSFVVSNIYSVIVFAGLSAIVFALDKLFKIKFDSNIYVRCAILVFILFNVITFLSDFPKTKTSYTDYKYPLPFRILLIYILLPLVIIYTAILIVYFAKSLILWEIPQGIIVNLVIWFSIFCVFYLFFISRIETNNFLNKFKKVFPFFIFPLLAMMYFALIIRINEYGMTENRYLVFAFGIWIFLSMIYFILYRDNSNITIPILLCIILLCTSIGPISATRLTEKSQKNRFVDVLKRNNMISGDKIIPNPDISSDDKKLITGILQFMDSGNRLNKLGYLPDNFKYSDESVTQVFGFDTTGLYSDVYLGYMLNEDYNPKNPAELEPLDIEGYKSMVVVDISSDDTIYSDYKFVRKETKIDIYETYPDNSDKFKKIYTIDLRELKDKLKALRKNENNIKPDDLSIVFAEHKIIFTNLYFPNDDNFNDVYISFYLMRS